MGFKSEGIYSNAMEEGPEWPVVSFQMRRGRFGE
jgi:hypothetical protein